MIPLDAYRGPFAHGIFDGFEAAHVSGPWPHAPKIRVNAQLLGGCVTESGLSVHTPAYLVQMGLRIGKGGIIACE